MPRGWVWASCEWNRKKINLVVLSSSSSPAPPSACSSFALDPEALRHDFLQLICVNKQRATAREILSFPRSPTAPLPRLGSVWPNLPPSLSNAGQPLQALQTTCAAILALVLKPVQTFSINVQFWSRQPAYFFVSFLVWKILVVGAIIWDPFKLFSPRF